MSRILIAVLIAFSVLVSGLDRKTVAGATLQAGRPMHVTVSFDGLMVFHREKSGYEVGVHSHAEDHTLKVLVDGVPQSFAGTSDTWNLAVTGSTRSGVVRAELGHDLNRKDDSLTQPGLKKGAGQYDFGWIINLSKLNTDLRLKSGAVLTPIIHLTEGIIYSRYKADFMNRLKVGKPAFGFFTETVALDVQLDKDQALVLSDDMGKKIFEVLYSATEPTHEVAIENTRDDADDHSDFSMYYELFDSSEEHYDFEPAPSKLRPFNAVPRPQMLAAEMKNNQKKMKPNQKKMKTTNQKQMGSTQKLFTCCGLKCNAIEVDIPLR